MEIVPDTIRTHDGLALAAEHHLPPDARTHVVVVHGFGEHRGRYAHVAAALTAAGYGCHLFDLRGHGTSQGPRGHVRSFEAFHDDLDRVADHARRLIARTAGRRAGAPRLVVLGHSLGGLIALDHEIQRPGVFAALVASSPFVAPAFAVSRLGRVVSDVVGRLLPALRVPAPLEGRWLSHDPEVVRAYGADPRVVRRITLGLWREIQLAQRRLRGRPRDIRLPALFLLSGADRVVNARAASDVFRALGSMDTQLVVYDGYFHEVLNEVGKDRVLADLLGWLDAHGAA